MDTTQLLISGYLDGELTDDEVGRLAGVLESDAASLDRLVWNSFIHSQLLDWMDHECVHDHEMAAVFDAALDSACGETNGADGGWNTVSPASHAQREPQLRCDFASDQWGALAAALLAAASISVLTYIIARAR